MKSLPEQIAAAIRPLGGELFTLLRGISDQQRQTNVLLAQLVTAHNVVPQRIVNPAPRPWGSDGGVE